MSAAALAAAAVVLTGWLVRSLLRVPPRVVESGPGVASDPGVADGSVACGPGVAGGPGVASGAGVADGPGVAGGADRARWPAGSRRVAVTLLGRWKERRRARATAGAWPSVADEIGGGLRAGASLRQALHGATGRGGAAGARLADVLRPVDRGAALAEAAGRWATSATEAGEVLVAHAVELAAASGHAPPLLFDTVADGLRERAALAGEVRAQTAQARASALALGLLPLAFTGLLALTDPSVPRFLVGSEIGWACLTIGLGLDAAGGWWMHRIIAGVLP